jgi:hypothetical protein
MLTVGTNTQVDLLLEGVGLESFGDTEDSILLTQLRQKRPFKPSLR